MAVEFNGRDFEWRPIKAWKLVQMVQFHEVGHPEPWVSLIIFHYHP